jgi:hypothetical protein
MKRIAVFLSCFFLCGAVHGQNVIITQAECNFLSPDNESSRGPMWVSGSIGTNILVYKTLIQDEVLLNFGGISNEFLFNISDNIFVLLNTKVAGIRAGLYGGAGLCSGEPVQFFLNAGFLVGIHVLPESLFSFTLDIKPGYTGMVEWDYNKLQHGWTFPIALGVRLNLDKL